MIPRFQRILFWTMLLAAVVMAIVLIRLRERAHDRLLAAADSQPLTAPSDAPTEKITLLVANDVDGSLIPVERSFPMPKDPNARARVLIQKLLEEYAAPKSPHPIANASGVDEVFLMPVQQQAQQKSVSAAAAQMAVVNLNAAFVEAQPSGIEPETLTLLSMIATLHANLPQIAEVRFLVDGQQKETLAGHADLTRIYLASDTQTAVRQ